MSTIDSKSNRVIDVVHSRHYIAQQKSIMITCVLIVCVIAGTWCVQKALILLRTRLQVSMHTRGFSADMYQYNKALYAQRCAKRQQKIATDLWYQEWLKSRIIPWESFERVIGQLSPHVCIIDYFYPSEGVVYFRCASRSLHDFMVWLSENNRSCMYTVQKVTTLEQDEVIILCHIQKNNQNKSEKNNNE